MTARTDFAERELAGTRSGGSFEFSVTAGTGGETACAGDAAGFENGPAVVPLLHEGVANRQPFCAMTERRSALAQSYGNAAISWANSSALAREPPSSTTYSQSPMRSEAGHGIRRDRRHRIAPMATDHDSATARDCSST